MTLRSEPHRVQLSRAKGWRKPENTVVVARPSKWGNPFRVGKSARVTYWPRRGDETAAHAWVTITPTLAVALFREHCAARAHEIRAELAGKNLACWCKPGGPCHADVLLEIANGDPE